MRIRSVKTLKGGERLAEPVITKEKETLISEGTVLKPEYLDLISFLGIDTVCIEDSYESYEEPHTLIGEERRQQYIAGVQKLLEKHIYQEKDALKNMEAIASDIVENMEEMDENIVIDMETRNGNLYEHTVMVTLLSVMVAKKLKLSKDEIYRIALGALLHDLGLRYITVDYINYDMESAPASEVFELKKHTILAYSVLEKEEWLDLGIKKMILSHHERVDGSGYPLKQKIKDVDCNILQACDALDCRISGIEGKRFGIQETLEYMIEATDILFEKKIVKIIQKSIAYYPVGTKVKLNTGENGVVLSQTTNSIRPVIGILDKQNKMTDVIYNLEKEKTISILQIIN